MSTTSLKLPQEVKQLAITAAKHQGISPHAFMVGAIRSAATNAEKRNQFIADAVAARKECIEWGKGYTAEDVHAYFRARARGEAAGQPEARAWHE